jgi:hypothetical protein
MGDDDVAGAPAAVTAARSLSVEMTVNGRPRAPDPHVLEVRVHGISNTPPAQMLGLAAESITQSAGDTLGSFWTPKREALEGLKASPVVIEGVHHKLPPEHVRLEAYSWGALARLSATSSWTFLPAAVHTVVRVLWVLLLPFGLSNVAYWSRTLPDWGKDAPPDADAPARRPSPRRNGSGALVRVFGLALTLLLTTTTLVLAVDVVARQCYLDPQDLDPDVEDGVRYAMVCSALPDVVDGLARWGLPGRVAVLATAAMLAMLVVAGIGLTATTRFDRRTTALVAPQPVPTGAEGLHGWPWLSRPRFWAHERDSWIGWRLHVGATFGLAALVVSVPTALRGDGDDPAPLLAVASAIAAALVLLASIGMVARLPVRQIDVANDADQARGQLRPWSVAVLLVSLAAFGAALATFRSTSRTSSFVVLDVTLPVLLAALALLPIAGLTARRAVWWPVWAVPTVIALAALGLRAAPVPSWAPDGWSATAGVVALASPRRTRVASTRAGPARAPPCSWPWRPASRSSSARRRSPRSRRGCAPPRHRRTPVPSTRRRRPHWTPPQRPTRCATPWSCRCPPPGPAPAG